MSWTVALSGPEATRAKAQLALEEARIPILPSDHHALMDWRSKFPDDDAAFLTVECDDINAAVKAVEKAKWVLRVHYQTPPEPEPSPEQVLTATVAEMRAEIDALKAKVG